MRNIHVALAAGEWRGGGPPDDLTMQIITSSVRPADEPGWLEVEGWRYYPGDPGPHHAWVQVRADVLPADVRPDDAR